MKHKYSILLGLAVWPLLTAGSSYAATIDLGTAANFAILSKAGISTTGTTAVVGDMGVSPIAATAITGFGLTADSTNTFSRSSQVTGKIFASDYSAPTPTYVGTAIGDMQAAYTTAAGRAPDHTGVGAGIIGGLTFLPGVYKWSSDVTIPTDITLAGNANAIWIFQITGTLDASSDVIVHLSGGAEAANIFWQVAGQTTLETTSHFAGNILDQTAIVMQHGASLDGRLLAQTAVTLDGNAVTVPASLPVPEPTTLALLAIGSVAMLRRRSIQQTRPSIK